MPASQPLTSYAYGTRATCEGPIEILVVESVAFPEKLERKKNENIKGQISSSSLIPLHTIHPSIVHV